MDEDDLAAKVEARKLDERKESMVNALKNKCLALGKMIGADAKSDAAQKEEELKQTFKFLSEWVDTSDAKHAEVLSVVEERLGRPTLALQALNKLIKEEKAPKKVQCS